MSPPVPHHRARRLAVAALLGCHRDEVAIVESATRAWDAAFYAVPLAEGDRILCSQAEYAANYIAFLDMAERALLPRQESP